MIKKCIECKYFEELKKVGGICYGRCNLHGYLVKTDETCVDFTEDKVNTEIENEKLAYLEKRIDTLESIVMRLL